MGSLTLILYTALRLLRPPSSLRVFLNILNKEKHRQLLLNQNFALNAESNAIYSLGSFALSVGVAIKYELEQFENV